jgi:tRNA A58 N-methylase Trm61
MANAPTPDGRFARCLDMISTYLRNYAKSPTVALTGFLCYRPTTEDSAGWLEIALKQWVPVETLEIMFPLCPLTPEEVKTLSTKIEHTPLKSWAIKRSIRLGAARIPVRR